MRHLPETASIEPVEPTGEVARKNIVLGLALTFVALLVVAGTVLVSLIYLHYD
jgi:uncharacterized membrane protein YqjE